VEDHNLSATAVRARQEGEKPTNMSGANHLFKLAQMTSEVKYLLHSISRKTATPFAYPQVPNIMDWHADMIARLDVWADQIPEYPHSDDRLYLTILCEIKYHGLMTLLLRPSPGIPNPSKESLKLCYQHSVASIQLYDKLYKRDLMVYSWATVHAIFLATITMLYCIWSVPEVAAQIQLEELMAVLKSGSNVLSATGEHWPEAKRSIPVLDGLSSATIRWIVDSKTKRTGSTSEPMIRTPLSLEAFPSSGSARIRFSDSSSTTPRQTNSYLPNPIDGLSFGPNGLQQMEYDFPLSSDNFNGVNNGGGIGFRDFTSDFYTSLFGDNSFGDQIDFSNPATVENVMQGMFADVGEMQQQTGFEGNGGIWGMDGQGMMGGQG
jgi:hypothetical protein